MEDTPAPDAGSMSSSSGAQGDGKTIKECKDMIRRRPRTPMVKFLLEHLEKSGCGIGDGFIKAVNCTKKIAGGYASDKGILVCSNHMNFQDEVNQVVIHELIHAYDDCNIGAGHLSGDCHYKWELLQGFVKTRGHEQQLLTATIFHYCGGDVTIIKCYYQNIYCSSFVAVLDSYGKSRPIVTWAVTADQHTLQYHISSGLGTLRKAKSVVVSIHWSYDSWWNVVDLEVLCLSVDCGNCHS
ncbi:hypothetical protein UlMin_022738 [Ulmus minor]